MRMLCTSLLGFWVLWAAGAAHGAEGRAPLDASLQRWDGTKATISHFRGKPTVVFYEDRTSAEVNRPLKNALVERGQQRQLHDAANVVAVANLGAYDFFPARHFAKKAVRDVEERVKIPVLIDWKRSLAASPWNLPPKSSSVLVLDAEGRPVFEHSGTLSPNEIERLFGVLDLLLKLPRGQSLQGLQVLKDGHR